MVRTEDVKRALENVIYRFGGIMLPVPFQRGCDEVRVTIRTGKDITTVAQAIAEELNVQLEKQAQPTGDRRPDQAPNGSRPGRANDPGLRQQKPPCGADKLQPKGKARRRSRRDSD